jgi:hypothetical protein
MERKKLTVVEVRLNKKYEVYRKDMINIREKAVNTVAEYPKNMAINVQVGAEVSKRGGGVGESK